MDVPAEREILMPAEAAVLFRVDRRTLARWVASGKLPGDCWFRTLGITSTGHLRYRRRELLEFRESLADG